jgi:hypothetical protein
VKPFDSFHVSHQLCGDLCGKHSAAISRALAAPDDDLMAREVHVLDPQAAAFQQPKPGAVQQSCDDGMRAVQLAKQARHLRSSEHDGKVERSLRPHDVVQPRQVGAENRAIQEQDGGQRLILR